MKHRPLVFVLTLALLATAACKYRPGEAEVDPLSVEAYPEITVSGVLEGQTLLAEPPNVQRGDNRPLSISVPLRLRSRDVVKVQYRFLFTDRSGRPLDNDPGWHFATIRGREKVYLLGSAMDTNANDWQLQVREAQE